MKIAAMSDLHGYLPKIPPCDILIVAGDVCPDMIGKTVAFPSHQLQWFEERALPWFEASAAGRTILTWGNHDWCGRAVHPATRRSLSLSFEQESVHVVVDDAVEIGGLKVWASPWSNQFGGWAFMKEPSDLAPIYARIPDDVDIIVSHQPPCGYGDTNAMGDHCGSVELLAAIDRVKPRLVVCGHIHEARGVSRRGDIMIVNASVVDEQYRLVRPATVIDLSCDRAVCAEGIRL